MMIIIIIYILNIIIIFYIGPDNIISCILSTGNYFLAIFPDSFKLSAGDLV